MGDFLFDAFQPFHFYRTAEVDYRLPQADPAAAAAAGPPLPREAFVQEVEALPPDNSPEVFGLHPVRPRGKGAHPPLLASRLIREPYPWQGSPPREPPP